MTSESPNTGITSHKECFDADHTDKLCAAMYDLNKDGAVNDVFLVAGGDKKRLEFHTRIRIHIFHMFVQNSSVSAGSRGRQSIF